MCFTLVHSFTSTQRKSENWFKKAYVLFKYDGESRKRKIVQTPEKRISPLSLSSHKGTPLPKKTSRTPSYPTLTDFPPIFLPLNYLPHVTHTLISHVLLLCFQPNPFNISYIYLAKFRSMPTSCLGCWCVVPLWVVNTDKV